MTQAGTQTARVTNFIRFSADDYRGLAMYARAAAVQSEKDAESQNNPAVKKRFLDAAKLARERAEKCENAARVL